MKNILVNNTKKEIIQSMEANISNFFSNYSKSLLSQKDSNDKLVILSGIPGYNFIFNAKILSSDVVFNIKETLKDLDSTRGETPLFWWTWSSNIPQNIGDYLLKAGLRHIGDFSGMALDLDILKKTSNSNIKIIEVKNLKDLEIWNKTAIEAVGLNIALENRFFNSHKEWGFELPFRFYLGYLDNEPIATSLLHLNSGVAGVYWVATLKEYRNKGIGQDMTTNLLYDAKQLNYKYSILRATEMGLPVYKKIGFKEYNKIGIYVWMGNK